MNDTIRPFPRHVWRGVGEPIGIAHDVLVRHIQQAATRPSKQEFCTAAVAVTNILLHGPYDMTAQPLRIAFLGASGTGKTTLARWISETFGIEFNPVGSRSTAKSLGFSNPYDVDKADAIVYEMRLKEGCSVQEAARYALERGVSNGRRSMRPTFQKKLQLDKLEWESSDRKVFVTDRTPLDDLVYALLHCREVVDDDFIQRAFDGLDQYDILFFTPLEVFISDENDPARLPNMTYHRQFQWTLMGIVQQYMSEHSDCGLFILGRPDLGWRKKSVRRAMEAHLDGKIEQFVREIKAAAEE